MKTNVSLHLPTRTSACRAKIKHRCVALARRLARPVAWALLWTALVHPVQSAEFFVAPTGNDNGRGTSDAPFRTLERAKTAVNAARQTMNADIVVHVSGGVYRLEKPLCFGPEDSGVNGHRVIYEAKPGETPVITSLRPVTGWKVHDAAKKIYAANVGDLEFRQFYIGGKMATPARWPNVATPNDGGPYLRLSGGDPQTRRYKITTADWNKVPSVANKSAMEMVLHLHFYHHTVRFASAETEDKATWIAPQEAERRPAFNKDAAFYSGGAYFFQNAYEFMDTPGEWFLDPAAHTLYCKFDAPPGPNLRTEAPVIETLLDIAGTAGKPVRDLEFRGLTFEGSNWIIPSRRGFIATQFAQAINAKRAYGNSDYPPGMVRAFHAQRLAFRHNTFRHAGATGMQLWAHVWDSDIEGNTFYNCAGNALEIDCQSTRNPSPELQSVNVAVWNNKFERAGSVYSNAGAILAHFVKNLIVDHNEITDMPYSGMQIGDQPPIGGGECGCTGNLIRYNRVQLTNQQHDDGGGIYTLGGQQKDTVIFENYIDRAVRGRWAGGWPVLGVYIDNYTQFIKCTRNVIEHSSGGARAINHAKDNVLADNPPADPAARAAIIKNSGIKPGYSPRNQKEQQP